MATPNFVLVDTASIDPSEKSFHSARYFSDRSVQALAQSMEQNGGRVDQPIAVRRCTAGSYAYEPIYGRRRLLAALKLGARTIHAEVLDVTDAEAAVMSLRENIARNGPHLLERGWAYVRLAEMAMSQASIAKAVGDRPSTVSEGIRFGRSLPEGLLLQVAAEIAPDQCAQDVIRRAVVLSRRSLLMISKATNADNLDPLRTALKAIADGESKHVVTKLVRAPRRAHPTSAERSPSYTLVNQDGICTKMQLSVPPTSLSPADAQEILRNINATVRALEEKAIAPAQNGASVKQLLSTTSPSSAGEQLLVRIRGLLRRLRISVSGWWKTARIRAARSGKAYQNIRCPDDTDRTALTVGSVTNREFD